MATLHTVCRSPFSGDALGACLRVVSDGSCVLLIEDGVYGALPASPLAADLETVRGRFRLAVLSEDLQLRGLHGRDRIEAFELVSYEGFVALATEYETMHAWF